MKIIEKRIKENYPSKADFSKEVGVSPKDLSSKLKTVRNRIEWLNKFLDYLNLKIKVIDKSNK